MSAFSRLAAPALATLAAIAIFCALGVWQVQRLAWKEALIASVDARVKASPIAAPGPAQWRSADLAAMEYLPVKLSGSFDHNREIHLFTALTQPKGRLGGPGYLVFTPLTTDEGWTVFVNRGFVAMERKSPSTRAQGQVSGEVEISGLLRLPEARNWYSARDSLAQNVWYTRDPLAFAAALSMPTATLAPFIVDSFANSSLAEGMPQGGETIIQFPNSHLGYAITWFGLALSVLGVFAAFAIGRLREEASPPSISSS